jgi:Transcriptional regulators
MYTIKDIAKKANVSVTTVSNVIHANHAHVSQDTVQKIKDIIEEYHYIPNMSARSLVNNSSRIIGVINHLIPSRRGSFLQDPFHTASIGGIEKELSENGYFLMLRSVSTERDLFSLMQNWSLDGMIFVGLFKDAFYQMLMELQTPVILIDSYIDDETVMSVGLEDKKGAYLATKYLVDQGHRKILFASPKIKAGGVLSQRLDGYKQALGEAGIRFERHNVYESSMVIEETVALGRKIALHPDATAVFATADSLAAGILSGLREAGKRVPEDFSVVGFDDLSISQLTTPRLTTIHQDVVEKGCIAAKMLINQLNATDNDNMERKVVLPVQLIERESVCPPRIRPRAGT